MAQATDMPRNETGIDTALGILKQQFGERFQTGDAIREQHGHTTTWIRNQAPDAVVFARSTDDVAAVVKVCAAHKVPVIAFGTGTSLEGHVNAPAGGVSIDVTQMDAVVEVNAGDLDCRVQPGVTREALNTHLRDQGLFFPIDPGANASRDDGDAGLGHQCGALWHDEGQRAGGRGGDGRWHGDPHRGTGAQIIRRIRSDASDGGL